MSYPSRKKPSGSCQNINHLPDEVLEHLLSFLSTKEALATSILSKRWRYLWTRVPVLDFDCPPNWKINGKRRKTFTEFVSSVLMANKVASLNKFRLNCDIILGSSYLNTRIKSIILGRNFVHEVDISISAPRKKPEFLKLPNCFFTVKTLKVLKLSRAILIDIAPDDDMSSVCFPSLEILHLESVQYANDESVSKLLLGCTALEKLLVERSPEDNVRKFIVNVPTLKTLDVSYQTSDDKPVGHRDDELIINAPILEHLTIKDRKGEPVSVHLESVFVRLIDANFNFEATPDLSKLTEVLLEAKSLCIKCPDSVAPVKDHSFPCFHNLTSLGLSVCSDGWDVISQFLENSPNLEVLTLKKVKLDKNPNNTSNKFALKRLPCFLRSVYCQEFQGHDNELEMVEFLLKNVRTLELVEIYGYYGMSLKAKLCFLQKLSEFTRLSVKCKLRFD